MKTLYTCYFFVLCSLHTVSALKCFGCMASSESDCYDGVLKSFFHMTCNPTDAFNTSSAIRPINVVGNAVKIESVCVHLVYSDVHPKRIERGCGYIYETVDICDYMHKFYDIEACYYCNTDFCNKLPVT